jgi:molybdate transport system regulatory protein
VPKRGASATGLTHLRVTLSETFYLGPGRADLIEFIAETGSISEAARRMGMSYKRAWGLVQALNQGFGAPLIETQRGGVGQGAVVTEAGREVLARYRHMQQATREAIAADVEALTKLMGDMSGRK